MVLKDTNTLICSVCGGLNDVLDLRCPTCGAVLQERQPVLHLFHTLFGVVEAPTATFHRVAISERKNYVHFLASLLGPGILTVMLMVIRAGDHPVDFGVILLALVLVSPLSGFLVMPLIALGPWLAGRIGRTRVGGFRRIHALLAYAFTPLVWYGVIIVPLALAIFGPMLFSCNPSPVTLKPAVFCVFSGLGGLAALWSLILSAVAMNVVRIRPWVSIPALLTMLILLILLVRIALDALGPAIIRFLTTI